MIPSVTEVLKPWMDLSHIAPGSIERGAARHAAYSAYLLGTWAPAVDPQDEGQLKSFKRWVDKYVQEIFEIETRLTDEKNGYRGTIDFIGKCPMLAAGGGILLDWKPPAANGPIVRAQVAAYLNLARKNNFLIARSGFLRMDPDGGIAKMEWIDSSGIDFNGFLSALNAYRYFKS